MPRTRSGEPIHRESRAKGTFERIWWTPIGYARSRQIQAAAERFDQAARRRGDRTAPIGRGARDLLGLLLRLQGRDGRLDPAYTWLADTLGASIDSIWRWLGRLETAGLLERMRRVERCEAESGSAWRQASNAYRILLPAAIAACLPVVMTASPVPDDVAVAAKVADGLRAEQLTALTITERVAHEAGPELNALEAALARWATAFSDSRDSETRNESRTSSSLQEDCGVALTGDNLAKRAPAAPGGAPGGERADADRLEIPPSAPG